MNPLVVYDLETSDKVPTTCYPLEVCAQVYNPRTLKPYPNGLFHSFMDLPEGHIPQEEALKVNGIKREDIAGFPNHKVVWNQFVDFIRKFNSKGTDWTAPISVGKNIRNFDNIIARRMCAEFCPNKEKTVLFNSWRCVDLEDLLWPFFESEGELKSMKMDELRPWLGMETEGAHGAKVDCFQEGALAMRFLGWLRNNYKQNKSKFKGSFRNGS